MSNKKINFKKWIFVIFLVSVFQIPLVQGSGLGEDLKGECIATLPDQGRSELLDIKMDLEDSTEEGSSDTTETKSK